MSSIKIEERINLKGFPMLVQSWVHIVELDAYEVVLLSGVLVQISLDALQSFWGNVMVHPSDAVIDTAIELYVERNFSHYKVI